MTLEQNVRETNSVLVAIKDKIVECGVEVAEGTHAREYAPKIEQVYEEGKKSQYDAFWDAVQLKGTRTNYSGAFIYWGFEEFRPKYPMKCIGLYQMFQYCTALKKITADITPLNDGFDNIYAVFYNCYNLEEVNFDIVIKNTAANLNILGAAFSNCQMLKTIKRLVLDGLPYTFSNSFYNCFALENLIIEGEITSTGLNLQYATLLSKASITSIINALSTTTSGLSVTLSSTAVKTAFGSTDSSEWNTLIDTRKNWTINLI